jgi:hypothetical protein
MLESLLASIKAITVSEGVKETSKLALSTFLVYSTHFGAVKAYHTVCVPDGVYGYLQGLISAGSPSCKFILDTITVTQNHYSGVIMVGISRLLLSAIGI